MNEKLKRWVMNFDQWTKLTEKRKKWLLEFGQLCLGLLLGNLLTLVFITGGYVNGKDDGWVAISVIGLSLFWFCYIDLLKWLAKKVPDEKRKQETEVCDQATH
jgi:fatty acid desaturase